MLTVVFFYATFRCMYIRRTTIKSRKDGGQYYTYRLVESKRTEKGVRQYTLLNLGVGFTLPYQENSGQISPNGLKQSLLANGPYFRLTRI